MQTNNSTYSAIPKRMRGIPNWVCWKLVHKKAGGKPSKVPINPTTGAWAKSDDPDTWSDFDTAVAESHNYDGIGFQFTGSGLLGVDLDHCLDENNNLTDWGKAALEALGDSYYEKSPSGDGIHIILEVEPGREEDKGVNLRHMPDVHGGIDGAIEIYSHGRYFTVTGIGEERDISPAPEKLHVELLTVHKKYIDETARRKFTDTVRRDVAGAVSSDTMSALMGGGVYSGRRLTKEQITELLGYIDPDCSFDDWLKIILAIHSWDETEVGFETADTWSQGGEKYLGPDDVQSHWKTGDNNKAESLKTSVGTLFHYARLTLNVIASEQVEEVDADDEDAMRKLMQVIALLDFASTAKVKARLRERGVLSADEFDDALEVEGGSQKWSMEDLQQMIDDADSDDVEHFTKINERVADSKSEIGAISADALIKAIKKKSGISMGALRDAAAAHQTAAFEHRSAIAKDASHGVITKHFIGEHEEYDGVPPVSAGGAYHRLKDNLWTPMGEQRLEVQIAQRYPDGVARCTTKSDYRSVARHCYDTTENPEFFTEAPVGVAMSDGFLTMDGGGRLSTEPLEAEHRQKVRFPFIYDRKFATPLWDAFIERSLAGDDMDEQILHLQEIFGATVLRLMPAFQQAALFIGGGNTGKSTALAVLQGMIPPEFCCSISPTRWDAEYYTAMLAGKYLNVVGELPEDVCIPAAAFKQVTGGDLITGRHPSGKPFWFRNEAAHVFNTNFFPTTRDRSSAFFRRWRIVEFDNVLPDTQVEGKFEQRLLTELSGIIAWAVDGAVRLRKEGAFTGSATHTTLKQKWMNESDSVLSFLHDEEYIELNLGSSAFESGHSLYLDYQRWCRLIGRKALGMHKFSTQMESPVVAALGINKTRNNNIRGFLGLRSTPAPLKDVY